MQNVLLSRENELFYACGYSCDNALYLESDAGAFFITDGRYTLDAKENVKEGVEVIESRELLKKAREILLRYRIKEVVIDPKEWSKEALSFLEKAVRLKKVSDFSQKKREIKRPDEIETIRKSVKEGAKAFKSFAQKIIHEDEFTLSYRFKSFLTDKGRRDLSFEPIVAINENSVKPHATLTSKVLQEGDVLLLDAGIKYERYCSDRTRTISINSEGLSVGKSQTFNTHKKQNVYDTVLKAQEAALKAVKVGTPIKELDKIAREIISDAGYGKFFVHSLGHGVGLDIHEYPFVNKKNDTLIKEGMVFTIEPGIYLPGEFGVRIEDMVVVDHDGSVEVMSEFYE